MPTETLAYGLGTRGSHSVLLQAQRIRYKASVPFRRYALEQTPSFTDIGAAVAEPVQSAGESRWSVRIGNYMGEALEGLSRLASEFPRQTRVTASPLTRAAAMDPWKVKNGRRIRLIEKKHQQGLDQKEAAELARLKREVAAHMQIVAPRASDVIDEMADRIEILKKKVAAKRGKKA
jgi:hypothetical protein